jgi:hypothetical protein
MALRDLTEAERLVLADRFALFLDTLGGTPGMETLLAMVQLMTTSFDQPTDEDLAAMFPNAGGDEEGTPARPPARGVPIAQALRLLKRYEAEGSITVTANRKYINLWRRDEETGELFPLRIARISREQIQRALARPHGIGAYAEGNGPARKRRPGRRRNWPR